MLMPVFFDQSEMAIVSPFAVYFRAGLPLRMMVPLLDRLFLAVMARRRCHGLPIATVPEQPHIATVRHDMIDHIGNTTAPAGAVTVLRLSEKRPALLLPFAIVATLTSSWATTISLSLAPHLTSAANTVGYFPATATDARGSERH